MDGYHNARTTAPQLISKLIQWNLDTTNLYVTGPLYKREPQYNETSVWRIILPVLWPFVISTVSRIETDLRSQNKDSFEFNNHLIIILKFNLSCGKSLMPNGT